MRVGVITSFGLQSPSTWPKERFGFWGNARSITEHLGRAGCRMEYFGPLHRRRPASAFLKHAVYRFLLKKKYYSWANPDSGGGYARQLRSLIRSSKADLLFCPEHTAIIAGLEPDRPLVLWTDAPLGCQIDFYPYLTNLCKETRRGILRMEQRVIDRCDRFVVASDWARREVLRLYDADPEKVKTVPRGVRTDAGVDRTVLGELIPRRMEAPCRLLFIGVDWRRKGGDQALAVAKELNRRGRRVELSIVGCEPDSDQPLPDYVKPYGTVDRSTEEGAALFRRLLRESCFSILPTTSDIVPAGLSEPLACGVPGLSTDVGGIPDIVEDGLTGRLFPLSASVDTWCDAIEALLDDRTAYETMAYAAFSTFEERFSWSAVARAGVDLLQPLAGSRGLPSALGRG